MGWLPQSYFTELRDKALALTREQRLAMTWEQAAEFVAPDTLEMASWSGLRKRTDITPWNAVCILRHISQEEGDPNVQAN